MFKSTGVKSKFFATFLVVLFLLSSSFAFAGHGEKTASKKGILLVAFGSSIPEAQVSFENIEKAVKKQYPNVPVRWAFSSAIIRDVLSKRGVLKDSPIMALAKMSDEGFTDVAVQSLHTIPGEEFEGVKETALSFEGMPKGIKHISVGEPLMFSDADMHKVVEALIDCIPAKRKANEAVVLMGHGTPHMANIYYSGAQTYFAAKDKNILVGTVEGTPTLDDVKAKLKAKGIKKVYLMPFMSVAGDHARNDMAGPEADSWKSELTKAGFKCEAVLKGTAEYPEFIKIWVEHLATAYNSLD